jgi:hypothetical protein
LATSHPTEQPHRANDPRSLLSTKESRRAMLFLSRQSSRPIEATIHALHHPLDKASCLYRWRRRPNFGAQRSIFGARRCYFGVLRSIFGARRCNLGSQRSIFGSRRGNFDVQRSSFGLEQCNFAARVTTLVLVTTTLVCDETTLVHDDANLVHDTSQTYL